MDQVFRPPELDPARRLGTYEPALGGDDDLVAGQLAQSCRQKLLGLAESVGLGRVEEGDTLVGSPADGFHRRDRVRRSPVATQLPGAKGDP